MFQVLENGKTADNSGFPKVHHSWVNSKFDTFEDAEKYLTHWLSGYRNAIPKIILPNVRYEYNGMDWVEIRTIS